jgi:hypothetical protein
MFRLLGSMVLYHPKGWASFYKKRSAAAALYVAPCGAFFFPAVKPTLITYKAVNNK